MKQSDNVHTKGSQEANSAEGGQVSGSSHWSSLGGSLRHCVRRITLGHKMREPVRIEALRTRGVLALNREAIFDRPHSTATLSALAGVPLERIGALFDINLAKGLVDNGIPAEKRESYRRLLTAAQSVRRQFNRLAFDYRGEVPAHTLARILQGFEKQVAELPIDRRMLLPLAVTLEESAHHLQLCGRHLSWENAREVVAYVLAAAREVVIVSAEHETEALDGVVPDLMRAKLAIFLEHVHHYSRECAASMNIPGRKPLFAHAHDRLISRDCCEAMQAEFRAEEGRSAPAKLVAAGRRSVCGVKLGMLHALDSAQRLFERDRTQDALRQISETLELWRGSDGTERSELSRSRSESLQRNLFSVAGTSHQAIFRDSVAPIFRWAVEHFDRLQPETLRHLATLAQETVHALQALTIREMAITLDAMKVARMCWDGDLHSKWVVKRAFPGSRALTGLLIGSLRGTAEYDPFIDRMDTPLGLNGPTMKTITHSFDANEATWTPQLEKLVRAGSVWAKKCARHYRRQIPTLPNESSLWVAEFDGSQGARVPHEVQREFELIQDEVKVAPGSRASGLITSKSGAWLQKHIAEHDGILLTVSAGDIEAPLAEQKPTAIFIATCSQTSPSPTMRSVKETAAPFIEALPKPSAMWGENPHVLCELSIAPREAQFFFRTYGEHIAGAMYRQFLFNAISRFPTAERIECFARCREGSLSMKAHGRLGFRDTGHSFVDGEGRRFHILHKAIFPCAVVLGYSDIE